MAMIKLNNLSIQNISFQYTSVFTTLAHTSNILWASCTGISVIIFLSGEVV